MTSPTPTSISDDAARFDAALARLETSLGAAVQKVADLARRTGFEDGIAHASSQIAATTNSSPDITPILREELEAARAREAGLQEAVIAARTALDDAMDDIRAALGPI
jgi:hypothetical protein